jgi:prepilin-type N-terminal cleavage/methylation domain-containing protein
MPRTRRSRQAFTLVELLVVIGIIAVLIGILMPSLSKARQQATAVKCASNLRSVGQQIMMYANMYKGVLCPPGDANGNIPGTGEPDLKKRWPALMFAEQMKDGSLNDGNKYVPEVMRCPADDREILDKIGGSGSGSGNAHSYNFSGGVVPKGKFKYWLRYGQQLPGIPTSDTILMVEKQQNIHDFTLDVGYSDTGGLTKTINDWYTIQFAQDPTDAGLPDNPRPNNKPKYKHGKMLNYFLFLDFSVRNDPPKLIDKARQGAPHNHRMVPPDW